MHFLSRIAGAAMIAGALLSTKAAAAQQTIESLGLTVLTTPAIVTDYMFRGISQTRSGPAIQGTIDVEHSSGLYVGAFVSNATFRNTNVRQEVDANFGYRFAIGDLKLDIGGTYFGYPGYEAPTGGFDIAWWEATLRASYEIAPVKFLGQVAYSPNFSGESGAALYAEIGFDWTLDFGITMSARAGYQWIERNVAPPSWNGRDGYFGTPDYGVLSFGFTRELFAGIIGGVTGIYSTLSEGDCFGGQQICGMRVVGSLTRPF
jgi:uncharacterized protein (TIGR02001 family)